MRLFVIIYTIVVVILTTCCGVVASWLHRHYYHHYHHGVAPPKKKNKAFLQQQQQKLLEDTRRRRNLFFRLQVASPPPSSDQLFILTDDQDDQQRPIDEGIALQERNLRFSGVGRLYATTATESSSSSTNDSNSSVITSSSTTTTTSSSSSSSSSPHLEILDRLANATVMVVGLGGVGSWAAEALCRSGIGTLVLVDLDDICISNTNRQLHATSSSIGRMKLDEMKHRLLDINPRMNVTLIHDFVSVDNVYDILDNNDGNTAATTTITALLDAMDGTKEKTALLAACVDKRIPVVTCGAAAGRMDPTKIIVDDIINVSNDRLLGTCRKILRKQYNFERGVAMSELQKQKNNKKNKKITNKKREWKIQAVFSTEVPKPVCQQQQQGSGSDNTIISSFRRCDGPLGTACFATGTYGFVAASVVVEMIATNKLVYPKQQQQQQQQQKPA